ncbi:MAG: cobalt-precorrin-5B (C(1))-methyltransferase [Rhodobacteraceae bacterium]|nr:cobalt-precorrin-5B (C(1))-methyltransferase [Paracoccaceae bacterium]
MNDTPDLRRGWTTGACATAATKAALQALWGGVFPASVTITLPKGETPTFPLAYTGQGAGWTEVGITKNAGDDPDVTHGCLVSVRVSIAPGGITFKAGTGVGKITRPGLPIPPGEPAINPVPRQMMTDVVEEQAAAFGQSADVEITVSIPGGAEIAKKTWNPRLGIKGGLSILGTTGVVRPFSCAAWIASIHRGIDVARACGLTHIAGCTGATSERVVQGRFGLPDHAMLDMGDFAGGMLKYLCRHPIPRLTIGGGIGKMAKFAQGAMDLHSSRSLVNFAALSDLVGQDLTGCISVLEALSRVGEPLGQAVATQARAAALGQLRGAGVEVDVVVIDRAGTIVGVAE